ncbi:probable G-protein coupled receptor 132b [Pangasianodon hypophthalmus]|uniref:probable G-protein coupled receptor 132b n=1 Tax=Pangasianodon hypophthalmus TaxID=310915 RepID=UPI002306DDCF|nr:probable G-protein coupled receptor 132b [Pangasianodon hypophthalmus]
MTIETMHRTTMTQTTVTAGNRNVSVSCIMPYDEGRIPLLVIYIAVLLVGLPANMATIYLTILKILHSNVLAIYLLSLSLSDFTYLLTLPGWAVYVSNSHYWPWSSLACQVTGYVFFTNMYISIFLLCCISIDRYMAVVYALESRGIRHQRLAAFVTLAIWGVVGLGHAPVFSMPEGQGGRGEHRCFEPSQSTATVTGFNYARFSVGFIAPLAVLIYTNHSILASLRASVSITVHQKQKVRRLTVAVVLLFLLCFGPYHMLLLLRAITYHFPSLQDDCHFEQGVYTPYIISLGLSTINSAANPVLFMLSSDSIKKEIQHCMTGLRSRCCQCCIDSSQDISTKTLNTQGQGTRMD